MLRDTVNALALGFSFSILIAEVSFCSEIFHWVDEDGVVTFSDWAPANAELEVSKVVVSESNPPGYDPEQDPNSILVQADRTSERWEGLRELKEERREQRQEIEGGTRYEAPVDYNDSYYSDYPYYYRPVRPPAFVRPKPFKTAKRQIVALDRLGLTGERPYSINSSAHLERVNAGQLSATGMRSHRPAWPARPATDLDR